uniref:Uncharacterized protein n=1 Tax=Arundo donax TaxID=35708 RepID=A0A0A9GEU7_ARUDO
MRSRIARTSSTLENDSSTRYPLVSKKLSWSAVRLPAGGIRGGPRLRRRGKGSDRFSLL